MLSCRLLLLLAAISAATVTSQEDADVPTHDVFGAAGSSVQFPQVNIDQDTVYELKKGKLYVVVFHGSHTVREPYAGRGEFYPGNGTFLLRSLKKDDSGTYEHWVNMTVSAKMNLQVIERATEPTLVRVKLEEDLQLECTASGDGPLVVTILRDGKEVISKNVTGEDGGVTTLLVHCGDPDSAGRYTCSSSNPVSSETSNVIELSPTATLLELISVHAIIAMATHWCLLVIRRTGRCCLHKRAIKQDNARRKGADAGPVQKPSAVWQAITHADFLLGFLSELAVAVISMSGNIIPAPGNYIAAGLFTCFMVCRIPYCLERFQTDIISCITYACGLITQGSEFLFIPAFCFYVIYVFLNSGPCRLVMSRRVRWGLAVLIYGLVWLTLSGIFYAYLTRKEKKNRKSTAVQEDPENMDPEKPRTPGRADCGGPLDSEGNPQERLSMIPESNERFYDRDRVANG